VTITLSQQSYGLAVIQTTVARRADRNMFVAGLLPDGKTKSPANRVQAAILALDFEPSPNGTTRPGRADLRGRLDVKVSVGGVGAPVL
jgi:hypothetical protein